MTTILDTRTSALWHPALFYADGIEYRAGVLSFVRDGLGRGEPTLVAVPEPNLSWLRAAMTAAEQRAVETVDMARVGRNPGRIIGAVLTAFVRRHAGRRVRIVGQLLWAGRSEDEYRACAEHEALVNVALHDCPASILCPFDMSTLGPDRLRDARRTHPVLMDATHRWHSEDYTDPYAVAATLDRPLPPAPPDADVALIGEGIGPGAARRLVHDVAVRVGLSPARVASARQVVQELVLNTIVHAGGRGLLTVWATDEHLVCQVEDRGWLPDVLAGRRPPAPSDDGHGLYAVHLLADLVQVHRDRQGTTVRVHFARDRDVQAPGR